MWSHNYMDTTYIQIYLELVISSKKNLNTVTIFLKKSHNCIVLVNSSVWAALSKSSELSMFSTQHSSFTFLPHKGNNHLEQCKHICVVIHVHYCDTLYYWVNKMPLIISQASPRDFTLERQCWMIWLYSSPQQHCISFPCNIDNFSHYIFSREIFAFYYMYHQDFFPHWSFLIILTSIVGILSYVLIRSIQNAWLLQYGEKIRE